MSPRPPPKISLRHDWTKELGSKVVQQPVCETVRQPEGLVARQTKFVQSRQPTPNPVRDRSGRPDDMQDGRNTSRPQEINVERKMKIYCKDTKNESESLSGQNRVIKFCTDAGFLTTVEVGQYFMTKDTELFSQFRDTVACREYTLPSHEDSSEPKGCIRNTKIGIVLEVTTSYLHGKYGVEVRIMSLNKDNSHSGQNFSWHE